jgi:hypothetical protein
MALSGGFARSPFLYTFAIQIINMDLGKRITAFSELGQILRKALAEEGSKKGQELDKLIERQQSLNPWFIPENVRMAISAIAEKLTEENLQNWTGKYPELKEKHDPYTTAVIMAGNIPIVGFHDFLSVLISGNRIMAKTSSKDSELIKYIAGILCSINSEFQGLIEFTEGYLSGFDAVIATGSDNSSRYFEYYFGKYPHIIRKNRNSIGIITGDEKDEDFRELGRDIFSYFGLGCRNISKLYLPAGFRVEKILDNWSRFSSIINHSKYANNYEYNMAVWLVNREKFLDTGFILLREEESLVSPLATLYYEFYDSPEKLTDNLIGLKDKLQCIAGKDYNQFGTLQAPELWDYSDNIDTLDFLLKKNISGIS